MDIHRIWCMPNKFTFKMRPVMDLIKRYADDGKNWIDPFAGKSDLCEFRNDMNPEMEQPFCMEALDFLNQFDGEKFKGVIWDPPYSRSLVSRHYKSIGIEGWGTHNNSGSFTEARNRIAEMIEPNGFCISFGYNSNGFGRKRGFELIELVLLAHGGFRNDTICIVEKKSGQASIT
jgi:hypothetical protein